MIELDETPGAQTLRRGLSVLKLLARSQPTGLRMSDIGRKLDLNKATAVRLTRALVEEQFVTHDLKSRRYCLGPEAFAVGLAAEPAYALQRVAAPLLRSLALETGDWVFLSVVQGFELVCISRESGDIPYPTSAINVGDRYPLGFGAGGVALLASFPDDEMELVLTQNADKIIRENSRMNLQSIRTFVRETRDVGYSVLPGTLVRGYWGIAVPILRDSRPVATITLVTTAARLKTNRQKVLGDRMNRIVQELATRLEPDQLRSHTHRAKMIAGSGTVASTNR